MISRTYNKMPSEVLGIVDDYVSFCFNEACLLFITKLEDGEKPVYEQEVKEKHYTSFTDLYNDIERGDV